jgi:hypothetical protein
MIKILAALGLGTALMLTPVLAYADDAAAPKTETKMEKPKPTKHHYHRKTTRHKKKSPHIERHMDKPADAPKT